MYMKPTFPASGALWPTRASIQAMAFGSAHIGSGPGVVGLPARHVKPFEPLRIVRIPFGPMSTMVALAAMAGGAALMALAISALSPPAFGAAAIFIAGAAGLAASADAAGLARPATNKARTTAFARMCTSLIQPC